MVVKVSELFVFGRYALMSSKPAHKNNPARHTFEACESGCALQWFKRRIMLYLPQQIRCLLDAGFFNKMWRCRANQNVLFYHQHAVFKIRKNEGRNTASFGFPRNFFILLKFQTTKYRLQRCLKPIYLTPPSHSIAKRATMAIIAPKECETNPAVSGHLTKLV